MSYQFSIRSVEREKKAERSKRVSGAHRLHDRAALQTLKTDPRKTCADWRRRVPRSGQTCAPCRVRCTSSRCRRRRRGGQRRGRDRGGVCTVRSLRRRRRSMCSVGVRCGVDQRRGVAIGREVGSMARRRQWQRHRCDDDDAPRHDIIMTLPTGGGCRRDPSFHTGHGEGGFDLRYRTRSQSLSDRWQPSVNSLFDTDNTDGDGKGHRHTSMMAAQNSITASSLAGW